MILSIFLYCSQIGRNEQQLQGVLQNQEKFKQAVQNVNAQLDRIQLHITKELDSSDDVDKCVGDFKVSEISR